MGNKREKSQPVSPQTTEPTTGQPPISARKRARLEHERRAQAIFARMNDMEFSPEDEAILDELGI
jgi:hypothetical protein